MLKVPVPIIYYTLVNYLDMYHIPNVSIHLFVKNFSGIGKARDILAVVLISHYTGKNTVISPDFLVWKFCRKAQSPHNFCENS